MSLTLAILGRPNVGKSTLFNRLAGKRLAIVDDIPGVTRDRRAGTGRIGDLAIEIIDTAGFEDAQNGSLESRMRYQTNQAIEIADVALFLIDSRMGIMPLDNVFANWIRSQNIPVILVANKCEGKAGELGLYESHKLGLGNPIAISAEHGEGLADLYQALLPHVKQDKRGTTILTDNFLGSTQMAMVGRPNVGKSTLINTIIGEERLLTGPESGITRDSIGVNWQYKGETIKLIDTAGLRRKSKIQNKVESLSAKDSFRAIQYAQIVILVLDGNMKLEKQDLTIARKVIEEGRILMIAVNKWDIVNNRMRAIQSLEDRLETSLPQVKGIPIIYLSALTGQNINKLLPSAFKILDVWSRRIPTGKLNQWLSEMIERHPPPIKSGRRIRIRYITQAKTRPPTFIVFLSKLVDLPEAYSRFLVNGIRKDFNLMGVPLRLISRTGENPYVD
jgi:GTP-binding protein